MAEKRREKRDQTTNTEGEGKKRVKLPQEPKR